MPFQEEEDESCCFLATRMASGNSLCNVVRRGHHKGLDPGEGLGCPADACIVALNTESEEANHRPSCAGERSSLGEGTGQLVQALCHLV